MAVLGIVAAGLPTVEVQAVNAGLLQLRVAPALGDTQLGAGLHYPQAGDFQVGIVRVGFGNQPIQDRIGEHLPPLPQVRVQAALTGLLEGRATPLLDPCLARRLEIRPEPNTAAKTQRAEQQEPAWPTQQGST
ncbi:hypothetical protein D3C85_1479970 [compost metagenome]